MSSVIFTLYSERYLLPRFVQKNSNKESKQTNCHRSETPTNEKKSYG